MDGVVGVVDGSSLLHIAVQQVGQQSLLVENRSLSTDMTCTQQTPHLSSVTGWMGGRSVRIWGERERGEGQRERERERERESCLLYTSDAADDC